MNESLDKLLECEYACDFCTLEIPSMVKYRNEQRIKRKAQPFFKKIFDPYIEVVPRTTPKSWIIRKIEHSDAGKLTLLKYLQSTDNYFITATQYEVLLNKHYVYLCDHHIYSLDKHIAAKGNYCANCGEDYSIAESEHFGLNIMTGCFHTPCRRCHQDSPILPIVGRCKTQIYQQYCVDCKKHFEYAKDAFGTKNPRYIKNKCSNCGGGNLQNIETVKYAWSPKELITQLSGSGLSS
jgi:hypothetical protein